MTFDELYKLAKECKERGEPVYLAVKDDKTPHDFPKGEFMGQEEQEKGLVKFYAYDPNEIISWCAKKVLEKAGLMP